MIAGAEGQVRARVAIGIETLAAANCRRRDSPRRAARTENVAGVDAVPGARS
jgi:hypothetical protein